MQDEISWNENTCYNIYNPYGDTSPLEPCDELENRSAEIICRFIDCKYFINRGKVTDIKTDKEE